MMKLLYSVTSPFARKVRIVLAERKISYEDTPVPRADSPEVVAVNPNRKVPTLLHEARVLFESNLILEYVLKTTSPAAGGETPALGLGMTRATHHWDDLLTLTTIETLMDAALNLNFAKNAGVTAEQFPQLERDAKRVQSNLDWLEARATPEGFIPGEFSIQDVNLICALEWFDRSKLVAWRGRSNLEAIIARNAERPAVAAPRPSP